VTLDRAHARGARRPSGLIVCRSYTFDSAFYGLIARLEVNADAILGYRERGLPPEGDKLLLLRHAVRLKPMK
jgi:hypothetical protein